MKFIRIIFLFILILLASGAYWVYKSIWMPNVAEDLEITYFYIKDKHNYSDVVYNLKQEEFIEDSTSFKWVSKLMKYDDTSIKSGKYLIEPGWNNRKLIRILRSGEQETVTVIFNQLRTVEDLAAVVANFIEADSFSIINQINQTVDSDSILINYDNRLSLFIPNTYEFYWSTTAIEFIDRMKIEYDRFWNANERREKLKNLGLTENEVYTLASIVEKETYVRDEKGVVARVYLNRLKKGIRLQADPTVVFATGNFELRRVLNRHLETESPYNTYLNDGLPPGPIFMPDISTIDAVLNAEVHDYVYFCAKPGYSGRHAFAKTLSGHNRNAAEYRMWLDREKIK